MLSKKDSPITSKSRQIDPLVTSTLKRTKDIFVDTSLYIRHPGYKPKDVYKIMLSKLFHFPEKITEDDKIIIYTLSENLREHRAKIKNSPFFLSPIQATAETVILRSMKDDPGFIHQTGLVSLFKQSSLIFPNLNEYYGQLNQRPLEITIEYRRRVSKKHPSRYIGVGYKDKGSSQVSSYSGNPSWQETARGIDLYKKLKVKEFSKTELEALHSEISIQHTRKIHNFSCVPIVEKLSKFRIKSEGYDETEIIYLSDKLYLKLDCTDDFEDYHEIASKLKLPFQPVRVGDQIGFLARNKSISELKL